MPSAPDVAPPDYTWQQLIEHQAVDLQIGDVFIVPAPGTAWYASADGSVRGAGIWALSPGGTAWTVCGRDNGVSARCHDGREATEAPRGSVLLLRRSAEANAGCQSPVADTAPTGGTPPLTG